MLQPFGCQQRSWKSPRFIFHLEISFRHQEHKIKLPFHKGGCYKRHPLSTSVTVKSNFSISSSRPTRRAASRWSAGTQLAVKSIAKSIIHSQTQLAASRLMNWWTYPELPAGSWWWWRWRSRSWPGCCRQSCCQFLPCRIHRGCKPWPASVRFHHGYLQRRCNDRVKKNKKKNYNSRSSSRHCDQCCHMCQQF